MDTTDASAQSTVILSSAGVEKWQFGNQTDNTFFIYSVALDKVIYATDTSGDIFIQPVNNVTIDGDLIIKPVSGDILTISDNSAGTIDMHYTSAAGTHTLRIFDDDAGGRGNRFDETQLFSTLFTLNGRMAIDDNSATALLVEQDGVNDNVFVIDTTTPRININAEVDIFHTATEADDHALELDVDAAGFGDVKAIDINYITGGISTGEDEGIILINIDETHPDVTGGDVFGLEVLATDGGADAIYGMKAGAVVGPVLQESGTFANPNTATNDTATTNVAAMKDGSTGTNTTIFVADDDYIIIGATNPFTEMEFIIETPASNPGIKPTFEYSKTAGAWAAFTPVDGTNGFRNTGVVAWDAADLTDHAVHTSGGDPGDTYDIRITRTHAVAGSVSLFYAKTAATVVYSWDKNGDVSIKGLNTSGGVIFNEAGADVDFRIEGDTDTDLFFVNAGTDRVGIGKISPNTLLDVDGDISVGGSNNELRFYEGANYVGFEAPALAADKIWVLPDADGNANESLQTDGSGNLSWAASGGGNLEFVEEKTFGAAATTTTFSSLTGTDSYFLEVRVVNDSGSTAVYEVRINGDANSTDYVDQLLVVNSASVVGIRTANRSAVGVATGGDQTFLAIEIALADGRFNSESSESNWGSTDVNIMRFFTSTKNTSGVGSITQIEFLSSVADGLGVDTIIRLYKRTT